MPCCRGWKDYTPLHMAARYGHDEMASLLVKADASLEAKDKIRVSAWVTVLDLLDVHIMPQASDNTK